jgi:hypothetical protein
MFAPQSSDERAREWSIISASARRLVRRRPGTRRREEEQTRARAERRKNAKTRARARRFRGDTRAVPPRSGAREFKTGWVRDYFCTKCHMEEGFTTIENLTPIRCQGCVLLPSTRHIYSLRVVCHTCAILHEVYRLIRPIDMSGSAVADLQGTFGTAFIGLIVSIVCVVSFSHPLLS